MKKITLILLTTTLIAFTGCSKSDDNDTTTPEVVTLEGRWVPESYTYVGSRTAVRDENVTRLILNGTGRDFAVTTTFGENPNTYSIGGAYTLRLTITTSTGNESVADEPLIFNESGDYTRNGNSITFNSADGQITGSITSLTENTLRLTRNINEVEDDGTTITTLDVVETFVFSRRN